ncbi:LOW QUALITY PROTEIN: putative E3 ubiquitin-protein ligase HERC6 [Pelodytes ibericus]
MYCWGNNNSGQLGLADRDTAEVHFTENNFFQGKSGVKKVVCGGQHSLFILDDGSIFSCGQNTYGQLGRKTNISTIDQIHALEAQTIVDVSCGTKHSVAVCNQGNIFTWGEESGQLGSRQSKQIYSIPKMITGLSNTRIIQISCGHFHSIALSEDGRVFSWGQNNSGQLGLGNKIPSQPSPQFVKSLKGIPLVQVTAGGAQSFALSMLGTVFGWGRNNAGQLGFKSDVTKAGIFKPYAVSSLRNLNVVYISCGNEHTAVLTKDGTVYTFGDDTYGQLGQSIKNSMAVPQMIGEYEGQVSQVACGSYHTLVYVFTCNGLVSFGYGSQEQHGNVLTEDQAQLPQLPQESNISSMFSTTDLVDIHVKWIFAGNNTCFVSSSNHPENHKMISMTDNMQKICQLDNAMVNRWMKAKPGSEEYQEAKRKISMIFSSSACLVASFMRRSISNPTQEALDLEAASELFAKLATDRRLSEIVCSSWKSDLIPDLMFLPMLFEALSVILLLPENPIMHDALNCVSLVIPFVSAVNNLSANALKILGTLWSSLKPTALTKHIQMLKIAVVLCVVTAQPGSVIRSPLEMLKKLYKVNMKANLIVPINTFCIDEVCPLIILPVDIANWRRWQSQSTCDENVVIYCQYSFIFNFHTKLNVLQLDSLQTKNNAKFKAQEELMWNRLQRNSELPKIPLFQLRVRRSHVVEDTMRKLSIVDDCDLKKDLLVEFQGEVSLNSQADGREFFLYIFEEMVNPEYGMFYCAEPLLPVWFPSTPSAEKKKYFYFGVLCGLAIFNHFVVYLPFPLALFKKILGKQTTLEDLKELQPTIGRSMQIILDTKTEVESLELYFCLTWENKTVDLIQNGASVAVTSSNKHDYVEKCVDYIFNTSVAEPFEEFKRGLFKVCDKDILSFFQPDELMIAVSGTAKCDWNGFEKSTVYLGKYSHAHPTIKMFWNVFHALPEEDKKGFVFFITGNDKVALFGISLVRMHITSFGVPGETFIPEAETCLQTLRLPEYSNIKTLRKKLLLAIQNNKGFGKI